MRQRALVLVAHADDETLGAGGMISKLQNQGWTVDVVALSSGVLDVRGKIEDNSGDFKSVCEFLGVNSATLLGYPDQKFDQVPVADMANIGDKSGGMLVAGLFLQEFVQPDLPWLHLDIAGPARSDESGRAG